MKAYVEGQAPLKQGWHGAWHRDGHNGWSYRRQNGKGRSVPGIVMVEPLLVAQHPTQVVRLRHDGTIIVRKDR